MKPTVEMIKKAVEVLKKYKVEPYFIEYYDEKTKKKIHCLLGYSHRERQWVII